MIPDEYIALLDNIAPKNITHIGFVAVNECGQYLITEPDGHPYGVGATFSKVARKKGETVSQTLQKCISEQVGLRVQNIYSLDKVWTTAQSSGFYFAGLVEPGEPSSKANAKLRWCSQEEANRLIERSTNNASRQRDLAILAAASQICYNPMRRVLYMVRELHQMGFQRLRAPAYSYPLAWRCPIVPSQWTLKRHGGILADVQINLLDGLMNHGYFTYSSADGMALLGWKDAIMDRPKQLAEMFLARRRDIAVAGWGSDPAYAEWFSRAIELTAPNGVYYSFSEEETPSDFIYPYPEKGIRLPLPSPGTALDDGEMGW